MTQFNFRFCFRAGLQAAAMLAVATNLSGCKQRSQALAQVQNSGECLPVMREGKPSVAALMANASNPSCATSFIPLPLVRQTKGFTCGAASLQSILSYWGDYYSEGVLQRILKSHKDNGTSWKRIHKFVHGLNKPNIREKFDSVSGFDEVVDLNELRSVLADRDVQDAIKRKSQTKADFKKVLDGIGNLKSPDVNIDRLNIAVPGPVLALVDGEELTTDGEQTGRRVVRSRAKRPKPGEYSTTTVMGQILYRGNGTLPTGCPAASYPAQGPEASRQQEAGMTMAQLEEALRGGNPVLALTQAWTYDSDEEYARKWESYTSGWDSGHYVAVIGMDSENVYLMDPSTMGHYAFVPRAEFEKRWHDYDGNLNEAYERCPGGYELHHFGMVITRNTTDRHRPDQVTKMY